MCIDHICGGQGPWNILTRNSCQVCMEVEATCDPWDISSSLSKNFFQECSINLLSVWYSNFQLLSTLDSWACNFPTCQLPCKSLKPNFNGWMTSHRLQTNHSNWACNIAALWVLLSSMLIVWQWMVQWVAMCKCVRLMLDTRVRWSYAPFEIMVWKEWIRQSDASILRNFDIDHGLLQCGDGALGWPKFPKTSQSATSSHRMCNPSETYFLNVKT
jgi:hypothetical protein